MARTQGHGNPNWGRDETILALDLYFETNGIVPSGNDPRVIALSNLLRSLPYHAEASRKASFRNPDGVAFKIQNLRSVATGKGLGNVSATDRRVWEEFGSSPDAVRKLAHSIRAGVALSASVSETEDEEFFEGRLLTQLHSSKERNRRVRKQLIALRAKSGPLQCELCSRTASTNEAGYEDAEFEAHHLKPIASSTEASVRLSEMALVCACCHRLVHRAMAVSKRLLSLDEVRSLLKLGSPT